jgi:uncharacterized protein
MILVDTSGLIAAYDRDDVFHSDVVRVLSEEPQRILSPFVLAELDYLLATRAGQPAEVQMLRDVARDAYQLAPMDVEDIAQCIQVIERYSALGPGLADASLVVLADRFQSRDVLTLDQRHFRVMQYRNQVPFRLLPHDA